MGRYQENRQCVSDLGGPESNSIESFKLTCEDVSEGEDIEAV
jgi:hypothetical protein